MDVLRNMWDKIVGTLLKKSYMFADVKITRLAKKISKVPSSIRDATLKKYLHMCIMMHKIAFYQWRLKYPVSKY
jgi:hypothetical protein